MSSIRKRLEKVEERVRDSLKTDVIPVAVGTSEEIKAQTQQIRSKGYEGPIICFQDDIKIIKCSESEEIL